eukprot:TRINITY_DN75048_c0_g1_i1.p1 TRINITY_DN75048_c0_g1~~TRINITY_DN75048_c0_g1_i1.p1  ORF type:complete len:176 (-),score=9.99 TRINITY_DN75048_c0_g1_i1:220-747(-)
MGNSSPTGEVPVLIKCIDGTSYSVLCDIGGQRGADLAEIVARQTGLELGSFRLIVMGREIQHDTSETLLDKGFIASGGPSVVHLVSKLATSCVVISVHIEKHSSNKWHLVGSRLDGSQDLFFEVDPHQLSLKEVHSMIADSVHVSPGQLRLVCNNCVWDISSDGEKYLHELGGLH